MTINVRVSDATWRCIGASGIANGCCTDCSSGDSPPCPVPNPQIPELNAGDYVGRPLPAVVRRILGESASSVACGATNLACQAANCLLRSYLQRMAGPAGAAYLDHFLHGAGQPITHRADSAMSRLIEATTEFQSAVQTVTRQLNDKIRQQAAGGHQDYDLALTDVPWLDFWRANPARWRPEEIWRALETVGGVGGDALQGRVTPRTILASLIGGTKGCKVLARNLRVDTARRTYAVDLCLRICDHFGVDEHDLYDPGLASLWLLQHACPGPQRPFVSVIYLERAVSQSYA